MIEKREQGLDYLLSLDGEVVVLEDHLWVKFEVSSSKPTPERPHGIRYSLTLHDKNGTRLMGFDNAHAIQLPKKGKYSGKVYAYDHNHKSINDRGTPYVFSTPFQLVEDFWTEVDRVRESLRR